METPVWIDRTSHYLERHYTQAQLREMFQAAVRSRLYPPSDLEPLFLAMQARGFNWPHGLSRLIEVEQAYG